MLNDNKYGIRDKKLFEHYKVMILIEQVKMGIISENLFLLEMDRIVERVIDVY
jgi:hypothetical protein